MIVSMMLKKRMKQKSGFKFVSVTLERLCLTLLLCKSGNSCNTFTFMGHIVFTNKDFLDVHKHLRVKLCYPDKL